MATRADFDPSEIRIALANDPNAIQEFDLLRASDGRQELTLYFKEPYCDCRGLGG